LTVVIYINFIEAVFGVAKALDLPRVTMLDPPDQTPAARRFQFTGRIRSFCHAMRGIVHMVRCQHNAWIHAAATLVVLSAGFLLRITPSDWCWIVLAIAIVWTAEALNTALEFLADVASPKFHPLVRDAKDVAAGAVLLTSVAAVVIGAIVFWPHIERFFRELP
jgi:diacylglycerol kinase (ATP)